MVVVLIVCLFAWFFIGHTEFWKFIVKFANNDFIIDLTDEKIAKKVCVFYCVLQASLLAIGICLGIVL